jgi:Carbohydrate esterase, sialic acid-specific acetylesterase
MRSVSSSMCNMQTETTTSSSSLANAPIGLKCPARIITYGWGKRYVDVLLTFTLPALLAPGNLPCVASEVPCELVILTQRRFFSKFNRHPAIARIKEFCPVRLIGLDDLIVSKDKYGMTLTYALHRAFRDLGPAMTEHWQIFLNADFILADGSLRTVIGHLARGQRIVASPSYCTVAEEVIPELRKYLDEATSTLSISHRELARLILQHRHPVIRGKTVNQTAFHMRYTDQFYWSINDSTLLGYQMPVSIVGLRPERYVEEPNSYWDFGLIWEYCPQAEVCVIGDSDEFTMLELRDRSVAEDQIVPGPLNKEDIAERMETWVTPYQQHFVKFPLTLHDRDLPPNSDEARVQLRSFVDEVMSHTPTLPSHIKHYQWEYHWSAFHDGRRRSTRIRAWIKARFRVEIERIDRVKELVRGAAKSIGINAARSAVGPIPVAINEMSLALRRKAFETSRPLARAAGTRLVRPLFRRAGLEIIKSKNLFELHRELNRTNQAITNCIQEIYGYRHEIEGYRHEIEGYKHEIEGYKHEIEGYKHEIEGYKHEIEGYKHEIEERRKSIEELTSFITDYQFKLKHCYDYQMIRAQDQVRPGMSNLEPEFLAETERCHQYTTTPWERLYALHKTTSAGYQHAMDSGVYLRSVDSSDVGVRLPVSREEIGDACVLLIIGQSNGANHGETRSTANRAVFNFNPFDSLCYRACDPLLGATGDGGSPWCVLGDALIADGFAQSILLCSFAAGGSTVAEWAPGGTYHHRLTYGIAALRQAGFEPTYVLWHQGEADALYGTSAEDYSNAFQELVTSLRELGVQVPIYVAIASYFAIPEGYGANQAIIRRAQQSLISPQHAILPGPDTDTIRDRFDGSHMGTAGLREHARLWQISLCGERQKRGITSQGSR